MNKLLIRFTDQSESYTHGVEFGRILAKMEMGVNLVSNSGFPIREENKLVVIDACNSYDYIPKFANSEVEGWIYFTATKKEIAN